MSAPRFPAAVLEANEWTHVRDHAETALELPFFKITATNAIYEHAPTAGDFHDVADPAVDVAGRSAFATALEFSTPLGTFGVSPRNAFGTACDHAKTEFADSVREDGLVNVRRFADRELDRDDAPARAFGYDVEYLLRDAVVAGDVTAGRFALRGELWAGIWPTASSYAMAGGMFPTEDVRDAVERQAPAATLAAESDLDVDPDRDRERVLEAIRCVET